MRMLPVAVIVGAVALGNYASAQDTQTPKPPSTCMLPDKTEHALDTPVTVDGRRYFCLEVLDLNFQPRVAWAAKPPYTSEAMLRRDVSAINAAATDRADVLKCLLPDKTERAVNTPVTVDGRTYYCVEALEEDLQQRGVAWRLVSPRPALGR
jgi:hypothetical protein